MNKEMDIKDMVPVKTSERHVILDALRGFALLGICFANFPEFSLYTFQKPEITMDKRKSRIIEAILPGIFILVQRKQTSTFA